MPQGGGIVVFAETSGDHAPRERRYCASECLNAALRDEASHESTATAVAPPDFGDDRSVPNFDVRNRLRIAHEHAAAALHRAAMIHEEAAGFWEQVHEPEKADDHWRLAADSVQAAKEHEALAARFAEPSDRQS
jgi:hypothetical protein